jgi:hypothetical protein
VLIDVHAHFLHDRSPRSDWRERNSSRLRAGERVGITVHVASILGSWGATSPIYFPSPADLEYGNNFLLALQHADPTRIRGYVTVNPNFQAHALRELERCLDAGMIGIKLAASRLEDGLQIRECLTRLGLEPAWHGAGGRRDDPHLAGDEEQIAYAHRLRVGAQRLWDGWTDDHAVFHGTLPSWPYIAVS